MGTGTIESTPVSRVKIRAPGQGDTVKFSFAALKPLRNNYK
jgi:hypothetical protein